MSEYIIEHYTKPSFLKKQLFGLKINGALKDCNKIKEYLLSKGYLSKLDAKLNLIISDGVSNEIEHSYFLYKGYNKDGSVKNITKYTITNDEIIECNNAIESDIIIVDLYEKSVYLHSYLKDSKYIIGYLVKEQNNYQGNKTLIFSNEKVKINLKNINKYDVCYVIDDFVNNFII